MTPTDLLDTLAEYVEEKTRCIELQVRDKENKQARRPPHVYKMRLPDKESETRQIPYILLQLITGKDVQPAGEDTDSSCKVRIVVATYSEDGGVGSYDVLNVIARLRTCMLSERVVADRYLLRIDPDNPLEYIVYQGEGVDPYYLGEMMTTWEMPTIEREVRKIWQR